jgi:hypothetical protein
MDGGQGSVFEVIVSDAVLRTVGEMKDVRMTHAARRRIVALLAPVVLAGCLGEPIPVPTDTGEPPPPPTSEIGLIGALQDAYSSRNYARFEALFDQDFSYFESFGGERICRERWLCAHRRAFQASNIPPSEAPVAPELWLNSISIGIGLLSEFQEQPQYYQSSAADAGGLDPTRWRVTGADASVTILFETQGDTDYQVTSSARFVVTEDRTKAVGEIGKFTIHRIDASRPYSAGAKEPSQWFTILSLYVDGCAACPLPAAVDRTMRALEAAYTTRDPDAFVALLHPEYLFSPAPVPPQAWGRSQEERVHRRMFRPLEPDPGVPVSPHLYVSNVTIQMSPPVRLLTDPRYPGPTWEVRSVADMLWQTDGETDYQVRTTQRFRLVETAEAPGTLRIAYWQEESGLPLGHAGSLGAPTAGIEAISWSGLRGLYDVR